MANEDWLNTYREYSDTELDAEISRLDAARKNYLVQQQTGSKSFTRDLSAINEQYLAATAVRRERRLNGGGGNPRIGTTDYRNLKIN